MKFIICVLQFLTETIFSLVDQQWTCWVVKYIISKYKVSDHKITKKLNFFVLG